MKASSLSPIIGKPKGLPVAAHLAILCAAVALPLLLLSAYLLYHTAASERGRLEQVARERASALALVLDRDLNGMIGVLHALENNPSLVSGDLDAFDRRARRLELDDGANIVVRALDGQQLVNTRLPRGTPLPKDVDHSEIDGLAIATKAPQVSDLFNGTTAKAPLFMVEVPVMRGDEVVYLLGLSMPVTHLNHLLAEADFPNGWWATLADRKGTIIGRTVDPGRLVGVSLLPPALEAVAQAQPDSSIYMTSPEGVRNFAAFHRIESAGWTVSVAVPETVLMEPLHRSLRWIGVLVTLAMTASAGLAVFYSRIITDGVRGLARATLALGRGKPLPDTYSAVREVNAAGSALLAAEQELARRASDREELLRSLDRSPAIVRGLDGRISFWGGGAEHLYGFTREQAIGQISHQLLSTVFPKPLEDIEAELLANGSWEGELRHRTRSGSQLVIASHWALRRDPKTGEPLAVIESNADLTAKALAERQMAAARDAAEAANLAKSSFLAAVSHDLRQPFQAMRLFHQILEMQADPGLSRVIENMGKALASGEELLSAIVELSVIDAGKIEPKPSRFVLGDLLAEIAEECAPMAASANLQLRHVPSSMAVFTDRTLLRRMIRNLVVNAIRYTKSGTILMGCRHRGDMVVVQVADTGVGIPEDKRKRIFEEFYQIGNSARDRSRGLGLGLAIVSRLSALLDHPVSVDSKPGKGSVFSITLTTARTPAGP